MRDHCSTADCQSGLSAHVCVTWVTSFSLFYVLHFYFLYLSPETQQGFSFKQKKKCLRLRKIIRSKLHCHHHCPPTTLLTCEPLMERVVMETLLKALTSHRHMFTHAH
jgi:hypothetical protein